MATQEKLDTRIKQFVLLMINAQRSLRLYPAYNPIPMSAIERAHDLLREIFQVQPELTLKFTRSACLFQGQPIPAMQSEAAKIAAFSLELFEKGINSITFFDRTKKEDLAFFLSQVARDTTEIVESGGIAKALRANGVDHIIVNEMPRKVAFSEKGQAADIAQAAYSEERKLFDLLETVLTKDQHSEKEASLLLHLTSRPQDIRAVLRYFSRKGVDEGVVNIRLLERVVLTLRGFLERKTGLLDGLEQNLSQALLTLDETVSDQLIVNLIFSAVRNPTARGLVADLPPEAISSAILRAAESGSTPLERVAPAFAKMEMDPSTKNAIVELLKAGLTARGYQEEEVNLLFKEEEEEAEAEKAKAEVLEGREPQAPGESGAPASRLPSIPVEEALLDSRDARLLEILRSEASKLRADDHVTYCLLELMSVSTNEASLHEAKRLLYQVLPQVAADREFAVLARAVSWCRRVLGSNGDEALKTVARETMRELTVKKYILQAFEAIAAPDATPSTQASANAFLRSLDRDEVIGTLIEILGTEEMLSRRKILISVIASLAEDSIELLGKRIDDPKWYLVRNIVTIFAMSGRQEAIPYLAQTIKHPDFRVKKESVKALGVIGGAEAYEILVQALAANSDDLKELIIRSIGQTRDPRAIDFLAPLIEQRDFFWRDLSTKLAAIDACGRIRTPEAIQLLEKAASARSFLFPRRARAFASAAKSALASLADAAEPAVRGEDA